MEKDKSAQILQSYLAGLRACIDEVEKQGISCVAEAIYMAYKKRKTIYVFGNGGSSATASHMVCDLRKIAAGTIKPRIKAFCLSDNNPLLTAISNDLDYTSVFREQLIGQVGPGDVAIGISASGNSPNVLAAIAYAKERGAVTVGFIGFGGGRLKSMSDLNITISSHDYGPVEDMHLALEHLVCNLVQDKVHRDSQ